MHCNKKALVVVMVAALLGVWGRSQSSIPSSAVSRLRELEAKTARLQDDYKSAAAARDEARKSAAELEELRTKLVSQIEQSIKERADLKSHLVYRTAERDALQSHLVQFSRDLQSLAVKVELAAAGPANPPVVTAPVPAASPK